MTKTEKLNRIEKHLEWVALDVFPNDQKRALEQCYGFIQGITFFDESLFDDVTMLWENFRSKIIGGCYNEKSC